MGKDTIFTGQPLLSQMTNLLDKREVLRLSRSYGGERYVKSFDGWQHLVVMLYAVIMRFDSLREITTSLLAEANKLSHVGITNMPRRSTLSDANARRPEAFFGAVYRHLYERYRGLLCLRRTASRSAIRVNSTALAYSALSSDSRQAGGRHHWEDRLFIIDSTTITLFSNLLFKGVGRNPKRGKKKGGLKVHEIIQANEGVPCDVCFTSAAKHDSFMLVPEKLSSGDILAMDRAYIDYAKLQRLTELGVTYVTKMKKNLKYEQKTDIVYSSTNALVARREQEVEFVKAGKDGIEIRHKARIITYYDKEKAKLVSLLTNDSDLGAEDVIAIYRRRWQIETLFKQMKQNFPLRYFYGESANAIKIQIWVILIANLLLTIMRRQLKREWSFSNLATVVRILLMCYVNFYAFFESPEKRWETILSNRSPAPPEPDLFGWRGSEFRNEQPMIEC